MNQNRFVSKMRHKFRSVSAYSKILILTSSLLLPFMSATVSAGQLTARSAAINKSAASSTNVQFTFGFTVPSSGTVQGIIYNFCTTPLGTCTLPTGMAVQAATHSSQTGFGATAFSAHAVSNQNNCTMGTNAYMMCFSRTDATSVSGAVQHVIAGITAPSAQQSVYIRISLFTSSDFSTSSAHDGTVAVAFVDQLITNGRVQENLEFCAASIDAIASMPTTVTNCAALATTSIVIGVIDNSSIAQSPVATGATTTANNKYGILMTNTNGAGGLTISYFAEQATSGTNQLRNFRVSGATCDPLDTNLTDQCFQPSPSGGGVMSVGSEAFGMNIACIHTGVGNTSNLGSVTVAYNGDGSMSDAGNTCQSEANTKFAWSNSANPTLLTSASSVVDKEIVKVRYGATAQATTPTGSYGITTNFIATPTF